MKFNVNNYVRVKLTEVGKNILEAEEIKYLPDEEGFVRFQMWELMQIFGNHMWNGCDIPFETNIGLEENEQQQ